MSDSFEQEMERRQQMIADKLAEIGITVQMPIPFMKFSGGPIGGQIPFTWEDSSAVQQQFDADDEFAQIAAAMREQEVAEREAARRAAEEEARAALEALTADLTDTDEDGPDGT